MEKRKPEEKKEPSLPLFEYARQFDDFSTYDDGDHYFIHCLQTSGFKMKEIAKWMHLSDTALSIRMNLIDPELSRFNTKHRHAYILNSGDSRPAKYDEWLSKQGQQTTEQAMKDRMMRLIPHVTDIRKLCDLLEGKEDK